MLDPADILLVDDNPANLLALKSILDPLGQNLVEARSGEEALELASQGEFAVILLDVQMPGIGGFETARRLRSKTGGPRTPIVFLTAQDIDRSQLEEGYALGAVDFLVKPLAASILLAKVTGFLEIFQEKQQARRETEHFRLLVDGVQDYAIFMLDPQGLVVSWNPGAERIKHYKAPEIIGQHFSKFYTQDAIDRGWPEHELKTAAAVGRFEDEGLRLRKDGSMFWANVVITALRDEQGELRGFAKVTRDITERKQAEDNRQRLAEASAARRAAEENAREIQAQRELLRVTLASIGDGVVCTDETGRITFLNEVARQLMNVAGDSALGRPLTEVFRIVNESTRQPVENPAMLALTEGIVVGMANHTVLIAGTREHPIDDSAAPIRDAEGRIVGSVLVFRDISERKQSEVNLREQTAVAETLHRIGRRLAAELDLHKLVQMVTDEGTQLAGAEFGAFFYNVLNQSGGSYMLYTLSGVGRDAFEKFPMPRNTELFSPTFRGEGTVRLDDVTLDPRYAKNPPYHGMPQGHLPVRSYLAAPVVSRTGEVLGGLFFGHSRAGVFTGQHERLLAGIAGQAAVALDNARLLQRAQQAAERMNLALAAGRLGDWSWDVASDVVNMSERAAEIFGIAPGPSMTWTQMQQLLHEEDRERTRLAVLRSVEERVQYDVEYRVARPDGRTIWVSAVGQAIYAKDGAVIGMNGLVEDISQRRKLEESLRESVQLYRSIGESIDYGVWVCDATGRNTYASESFLRLTGLTQEECSGVGWGRVLHPDDAQATIAAWMECVRTGDRWDREHRIRDTEGRWHNILARGVAVKNDRGETTAWVGINLDISRLKKVEAELREADRRKDEFLATLAHELRNPLAPIRNGLQIIQLANDDPQAVADTRAMMERQLNQMVRLVDDLLDVSRITRNKLELRRQHVDLAQVIRSAVETSRPLIEAHQHLLTVNLPQDPVLLDADPTRLAQVFANLLNNSAKYSEPGGRIWIDAEPDGEEVLVRVRDAGMGIPLEDLETVFNLFTQVKRGQDRAQGGLGIGLMLVRRLVEMHGGSVAAHSAGLGQGSEFLVRLPRRTAESQPKSAQVSTEAPRSRSRVLVVDDNRDAATSLGMILKMMGSEVQTVYDGQQAVEAAASFRPAGIFLDLGLPKLDGCEACRQIRQLPGGDKILIVALTGWGQDSDRQRTEAAGFDAHLVKPLKPEDLSRVLARLG